VKAAADAERLAVSRCNSLEDDLRHVKKDLAGADAAIERLEKALEEVSAKRNAAEDAAADARKEIAERDQMLAYVSSEVESVKSMFAQREDGLRRERDDALAQLAERDEHDDELKAEARSAREDAAAARADAAEMAAAAEARVASIDARERAASDKVRRVESEMRALLQEVAQHKRQSQAKVQELMALI
jgi:chromosome segregation ATPase